MDKITLVKMLLASQEENRKLHDKLDKISEEAKEREAKAKARNEELMNANRRQFEYQIKLMDQLTDMQRQLKQTHDQYAELLVELKHQKDLNKQSRKDKFDTTKQNVDKDKTEENDNDGQRSDCVQQQEDVNGDYETLKDTPDEIKQWRNNKETSEIINKMRLELDRLRPDNKQEQSKLDPIFATALRYLHNQWDGLMRYRDDGEYSIDNNIAERNVRPFTVDRKNTMTFGSEEGIDCTATYHTIIQTCRMMGVKVLKYLQSFFKKFSEGCRDYAQMLPGPLAIV